MNSLSLEINDCEIKNSLELLLNCNYIYLKKINSINFTNNICHNINNDNLYSN